MKNKILIRKFSAFASVATLIVCFLSVMPVKAYESDAIIIRDASDWNDFASDCKEGNDYYEGVTVKLANDIIFENYTNEETDDESDSNYEQAYAFKGTFDGCGYTMSGLHSKTNSGLFNTIVKGAVVKNVTVVDSDFESNRRYAGGIAGKCHGLINNCHIKNTSVKASSGYANTGGIVGEISLEGVVVNCSVDISSKIDSGNNAGGICGYSNGEISNSANMGTVTGKSCGGIDALGKFNVNSNCYTVGTVSGEDGGMYGYVDGEQMLLSEMKTQSFCDTLNENLGTDADWLEWELTDECEFPTLMKIRHISECTIVLDNNPIVYDGQLKRPEVVVKYNDETLRKNIDYSVLYYGNLNAGEATVLIDGLKLYSGTKEKKFTIEKATPEYDHVELGVRKAGEASVNLNSGNVDVYAFGTISYSSSDNNVAKVDDKGNVSFISPGKAVITVNISGTNNYNPIQYDIPVEVEAGNVETTQTKDNSAVSQTSDNNKNSQTSNNNPETIPKSNSTKKTQSKITIKSTYKKTKGDSFKLKPTIYGNGKVTYKSSNKKVATVNSKGKVTCKKAGKATITIKVAETSKYKAATKKVKIVVSGVIKLGKVKIGNWKVKKHLDGYDDIWEIKWNKVKGATGYQLMVTAQPGSAVSDPLTDIINQKGCYYECSVFEADWVKIKVRAYKKVNGKKIYGPWSSEKIVKVIG